MQDTKTGLKVCFLPFNDVLWHLQVEELEEKLLDQTQEVERLRSELVRPCWTMFLKNTCARLCSVWGHLHAIVVGPTS